MTAGSNTYKLIPYNESIDLSNFYAEAKAKGFDNNADKHMLVDTIAKEDEWRVWLLYYNDTIVGSAAAHSFPEMGPNSYRIMARTCTLTHLMHINRIRTIEGIIQHQNHSAQFFMPAGIDWAGADKNHYITTNELSAGTQKRVHRTWAPALVETGALEKSCELNYRGAIQTVWKVNVHEFYKQLDQYGRWPIERLL